MSWLDSYKMACNEGVDSFADMDEELRALVLRRCAVYEVLEGCLKPEVGEVGRGGLDESDAREAV